MELSLSNNNNLFCPKMVLYFVTHYKQDDFVVVLCGFYLKEAVYSQK